MSYVIYCLIACIIILAVIFIYIYISKLDDKEAIVENISELELTDEGLENSAKKMAAFHSDVKKKNSKRKIMKSLKRSYSKIIKAYEYIDKDITERKEIIPAAEWLMDNLYLIEKEYKDIKHNMPKKYYKELPVIEKGIMKGYPRIYHIVLDIISHTDGKIDENIIETFIGAYQVNVALDINELWSVPIMLRIAVLQSISNVIEKIYLAQRQRDEAETVGNRIIEAVNCGMAEKEIRRLTRSNIQFTSHFTEKLLKILRDNAMENNYVYAWIDESLEMKGTDTEKMVAIEHNILASFQISISNSINGLRKIETLNYKDSFEKLCQVDKILCSDPSKVYESMDFESRDYYRHKIELIARSTHLSEIFIAKKVLECAQENKDAEDKKYISHVGYYIIDDGMKCLEKKLVFREKKVKKALQSVRKHEPKYYILCIAILTLSLMAGVLYVSILRDNKIELWRYILGFFCIFVPSSEIVITILNWSICHLRNPRFVPKLEFKEGIPDDKRTIIIIPVIVNSESKIKKLAEDIEVYFIANHDKNIYFSILADFADSISEKSEEDNAIVKRGLYEVKRLNEKYSNGGEDIFYFFCRKRKYNPCEGKWMGWERKRGKIMEFISMLRNANETSYNIKSGDITMLSKAKYIITLDADTILPRNCAKRLIGAMSHILNTPYLDDKKKVVIRGYGLMQPKINIGTVSANKTAFSKIFSGEAGIDMYSTAVSDVYQDLFGEGIFTGKGIFEIDIFHSVLYGEIPENTVLSHDLLEGSIVKTALVSDIEFIDGYPSNYVSSSRRLHRWVRGDWQLVRFFKNKKLNLLSKYKLFDNLRRSLLSPSILLLIMLGISILPDGKNLWIVLSVIALIVPILFNFSEALTSPIKNVNFTLKFNDLKKVIEQAFLMFCFLTYESYLMLDAIIRTFYRITFSKKNLLEWQTAADVEERTDNTCKGYIKNMWQGSFLSLIIVFISYCISKNTAFFMLPSCAIWFLCPLIAYYVSISSKEENDLLSENDIFLLRKITRKTYAYFDDFINDNSAYLPPDNFQENPYIGEAMRTSPTNIGMGLMAYISAFDCGYVSIIKLINNIQNILFGMQSLERYKGHFFNWYNLNTKQPLCPKYISTVDSGNLLCYIWITIQSLEEYLKSPVIKSERKGGFLTLIKLAQEEIKEKNSDLYSEIIKKYENDEFSINTWVNILNDVKNELCKFEKENSYEEFYWNKKVKESLEDYCNEIQVLFPWLDVISSGQHNYKSEYSVISAMINLPNNISLENTELYLERINQKLKNEKLINAENNIEENIEKSINELNKLMEAINNIKLEFKKMSDEMNFSFLYDKKRKLFSIAYNVEKDSLDDCYYDLLASESRQTSFIAIAKGDIEESHWFSLGRSMTSIWHNKGLASWSGTMFEYLMPLLIMKAYPDTILSQTYNFVIEGQIKYGKINKIPWGISESAFYSFDASKNYQYKAFGIPGVGLKRGLGSELVVSPYSTIMGLMVDKKETLKNIRRLQFEGLEGKYGFYEAIDYTKNRITKGGKKAIVKCFMVHHEGMSIMALNNTLNNNVFQTRFHAIPEIKATELLLEEKVPKRIIYEREIKSESLDIVQEKQKIVERKLTKIKGEIPETLILSNGCYSVMICDSGSGYSKMNDMLMYRWKEDATIDNFGMYFYIKDVYDNKYWSAAYEPCRQYGDDYEAVFALDKAEFIKQYHDIKSTVDIAVSSEDNCEVRKISLSNESKSIKTLEITSYCEVTLANYETDIVHPAFSNLFITTEYIKDPFCILAHRRPREKTQSNKIMFQTFCANSSLIENIDYETSKINFIGRNNDVSNPSALSENIPLKKFTGAAIDPIVAIRVRIKLKPGQKCSLAFVTGFSEKKEECISLALKYRNFNNCNKIFELSQTQIKVELRYMGIKSSLANLFQIMASKILFMTPLMKNREDNIKKICKSQSDLWAYGISGDNPIIILKIYKESEYNLVRHLILAHEYLSNKGIKIDIVIIDYEDATYAQPASDAINEIIRSSHARDKQNKSGGIFIISKYSINDEIENLLFAIARLVFDDEKGYIVSQIKDIIIKGNKQRQYYSLNYDMISAHADYNYQPYDFGNEKLEFYNGIGGFEPSGKEYIIRLDKGKNTPAPWINVISNGSFGFIVSESGSSYTWNKNSRENKISTWNNDWVSDPISEILYLRDEYTGDIWNINPYPVRDDGTYIIKHGFGYSIFQHEKYGIFGEMTMFVPIKDNIKLVLVKLKNLCDVKRELSLTYYSELVLGVTPQKSYQYISTYIDENEKYIYASNPYDKIFGDEKAYLKIVGGNEESFTGSKEDFIGRCRSTKEPYALTKTVLSNLSGSGMQPCLCANSKLVLEPMEEKYVFVLLGQENNTKKINHIIHSYDCVLKNNKNKNCMPDNNAMNAQNELIKVKQYWENILGTIKVKTPDKSFDYLVNGWLLYQTITCRFYSRSAFYQSGGAFGFRDQLQDVMSFIFSNPKKVREHLIYSASKQYIEGDVQHWWHPYVESGIRTRFSDDLLWLPYVTAYYIKNTGDYSILEEKSSYLEAEPLKEGENERYSYLETSNKSGTLYEHCIKAIDKSLQFGEHNIPLMGSGDWNDGMNNVGSHGKGESVWLGWFLYSILNNFEEICNRQNDYERAKIYSEKKIFIGENLNKNAWDGSWYRRAYFDNGSPLGSFENDECKIDSIAQSWSVISKGGDEKKCEEAVESAVQNLCDRNKKLIRLLYPPFDKSKLDPGYINGYIPGVRENGGQYTHAAIWLIIALCEMKKNNEAWELFSIINPINHARTEADCENYKVEPYVISADVYAAEAHAGRGGWSWYTGASGWMYRLAIENIIGLKLKEGKGFTIEPCIPDSWNEYSLEYVNGNSKYIIKVSRENIKTVMESNNIANNEHINTADINKKDTNRIKSIVLNGKECDGNFIPFIDGNNNVQVKI